MKLEKYFKVLDETPQHIKDMVEKMMNDLVESEEVSQPTAAPVQNILNWIPTMFDISDGDYYWKGDADGDEPLTGTQVLNIAMLPEYQKIISQEK